MLVLTSTAAWLFRRGSPAKWRTEQDALIVSDDKGRELWRKVFPAIDSAWHAGGRNGWVGDLDGDGRNEVLFAPWSGNRGTAVGPLFCYDSNGQERWRFNPGRTVRTQKEVFEPPFSVYGVSAGRLGNNGEMRVVVSSGHYLYYPAQVAILDAKGQLLREYWHAGHLPQILITDLDGKGQNKLLLAGVNNATKKATLLVLDPDAPSGSLRENNPAYMFQGMPFANETARLLFPRSCINQLLEPLAFVFALWLMPGGITIEVRQDIHGATASLYYQLNRDLTLESLDIGSNFELTHSQMYSAGTLDHELNDTEVAALGDIVYSRQAVSRSHR